MSLRKIIHVDMDSFYASVEIRDDPSLRGKPVAVGGDPWQRGVLCTANYEARVYGVRAAMPTVRALRLCPDLILLPVNMPKYFEVAQGIRAIFARYTDKIEPMGLDEAYLDVTGSPHCRGSATWIAQAIRKEIWESFHLTASAGAAPNKFLAKVACGLAKPNGLKVVPPEAVEGFVSVLPVGSLPGVGAVTLSKLERMNLRYCFDVRSCSLVELVTVLGEYGKRLYEVSYGIDDRLVETDTTPKSISVEETFPEDLKELSKLLSALSYLERRLEKRLARHSEQRIKNQFLKVKYSDFHQNSKEQGVEGYTASLSQLWLTDFLALRPMSLRLLGIGVHFEQARPCEQRQGVLPL